MRVRFHEAARAELAWEVQYYAKISPPLGERFATVVERALAIAAEFPDMGSPHNGHGPTTAGGGFAAIYCAPVIFTLGFTVTNWPPAKCPIC